jgi:hypothetical protein
LVDKILPLISYGSNGKPNGETAEAENSSDLLVSVDISSESGLFLHKEFYEEEDREVTN